MRVLGEERLCREDEAGRAVAALNPVMRFERLLDRIETVDPLAKALDRLDLAPIP